MKINSINNTNLYSKTFFGKNIYMHSPLKNIPGNRCACCGHEMISSNQISEMYANITLPLKETLKDSYFKNVVSVYYPQIYRVLTGFIQNFPDKSLDTILLDDENHAKLMDSVTDSFSGDSKLKFTSGIYRQKALKTRTLDILDASERFLKNSEEVIEYLSPLKKYMYDYRKDIFEELETLSKKYPDKKLSEIICIPEVYENYIMGTYIDTINFAQKRDLHWNKADEIILKVEPSLEDKLGKVRTQICQLYRGQVDPLRTKFEIKRLYNEFLEENKLNYFVEDVDKELAQIPEYNYTKNSFLSHARRYPTDGRIVDYMIKPFTESEEHIIPISQGGENSLNNKITICRQCNSMRAVFPYTEFLQYHPEMIENTENQIRFIAEGLRNGTITKILKNYPIKVSKTLKFYTNGLINPDISSFTQANLCK